MQDPDVAEKDQRRLHAWPDWDASIRDARARLAFDPSWTPTPGGAQTAEYLTWRRAVELRRLRAEARRALIQLHLPERCTDYWLACFFAPYEREGLAAIRDPQPNGDIGSRRVYPPPMELWFEAGIDVSTAPAMLVIEGPAALASSALLRAAERRALEAKRRAGFPKQHPMVHARQIGPVLADRARARAEPNPDRDKARRQAIAWYADGGKPDFIAYRLGQRGFKVSERTIRRWIEGSRGGRSDTSS